MLGVNESVYVVFGLIATLDSVVEFILEVHCDKKAKLELT